MTEDSPIVKQHDHVPKQQENVPLKSLLQHLNLPDVKVILDLHTVCGMDLQTAKLVFPAGKTIAVTSADNKNNLRDKIDEVLTINIEKDCLPLISGSVDIILADKTFSRVKEIFWVIHEVTRSLCMGGYLILAMPKIEITGSASSDKQIDLNSVNGIQTFLNLGYAAGYEWTSISKNRFEAYPRWLAQLLTKLIVRKKPEQFLILRKVMPYTAGFLDYKINAKK